MVDVNITRIVYVVRWCHRAVTVKVLFFSKPVASSTEAVAMASAAAETTIAAAAAAAATGGLDLRVWPRRMSGCIRWRRCREGGGWTIDTGMVFSLLVASRIRPISDLLCARVADRCPGQPITSFRRLFRWLAHLRADEHLYKDRTVTTDIVLSPYWPKHRRGIKVVARSDTGFRKDFRRSNRRLPGLIKVFFLFSTRLC